MKKKEKNRLLTKNMARTPELKPISGKSTVNIIEETEKLISPRIPRISP
jgi:hypothetical protein